jgi:hypothetical protein
MNLLMVVAVLVAVAIGEWLATVTFLFAVSLALGSESFMGTKIYQPLRQALFARADLLGARPVQMSCLWRV